MREVSTHSELIGLLQKGPASHDKKQQIYELRDSLAKFLSTEPELINIDLSLDYSNAYGISLGFDSQCKITPIQLCDRMLTVEVSNIAEVFTIIYRRLEIYYQFGEALVLKKEKNDFPACLSDTYDFIRNEMERRGLVIIEGDILYEPMENYFTQIDHIQAIVFQVFFSEA